MRGWLALGLALVLLAPGCLQKDTSSTSSSSTSPTGARATPSASGTGAPAATANQTNHPPSATLLARAGNGTAALDVTFLLGGKDDDGDALNWTLSFGDASANRTGAALPANVTHSYAKAGSYAIAYLLSDGRNTTTYRATLNLTAAATAFVPINETRTWTASAAGVVEFAAGCQQDGVDCAYFDLPASASGRDFTMTFTSTVPGAVYFIDHYKGGSYVDTFIGEPGATTIADKVPAGTTQFRAYSSGGAENSATLVVP